MKKTARIATPAPGAGRAFRTTVLVCAFAAACIVKLVVISGNEIVSEGSDSLEYLLIAKRWFWGFNQAPIRGPGYPLFVALVHWLGLPMRVTAELVFMLASAWFCYSLRLLRLPGAVIALVFAALLFHPLTFLTLDMPMSEGWFTSLMLVALGALVRAILSESPRSRLLNSALLGLASALMIHTRASDRYIIYLVMFEALACAYGVQALRERRVFAVGGALAAGAAILSMAAVNVLVFSANYAAFGSFGYNDVADASTMRLVHSLMTIDGEEAPVHPRILITTKARRLAYRLSPTLRPYESEIEGAYLKSREESNYGTYARTGIKGQLDTQDTLRAIAKLCAPAPNAPAVNKSEGAKLCNAKFDQVSDEIANSLAEGLAKRRAVFYVLNPSLEMLMKNARSSLAAFFASFFAYADEPIQNYYPFYGTLFAELYDAMAHRNRDLLMKGPLEGFLAIPRGSTPSNVEFVNDALDFMRKTSGDPHPYSYPIELMEKEGFAVYEDMGAAEITAAGDRATIPDAIKQSAAEDRFDIVRFRVPAVHDRVFLHFTKLVVTLDGGTRYAIRELEQGLLRESDAAGAGAPGALKCFITAFDLSLTPTQKAGYETQKRIFRAFNAYSEKCAIALGVLSIIAMAAAAWTHSRRRGWHPSTVGTWCVCAILVSLFLGRVVFYAIIDSTIFPINPQRHLFAASIILFPVLLIIGAAAAASALRARP